MRRFATKVCHSHGSLVKWQYHVSLLKFMVKTKNTIVNIKEKLYDTSDLSRICLEEYYINNGYIEFPIRAEGAFVIRTS